MTGATYKRQFTVFQQRRISDIFVVIRTCYKEVENIKHNKEKFGITQIK